MDHPQVARGSPWVVQGAACPESPQDVILLVALGQGPMATTICWTPCFVVRRDDSPSCARGTPDYVAGTGKWGGQPAFSRYLGRRQRQRLLWHVGRRRRATPVGCRATSSIFSCGDVTRAWCDRQTRARAADFVAPVHSSSTACSSPEIDGLAVGQLRKANSEMHHLEYPLARNLEPANNYVQLSPGGNPVFILEWNSSFLRSEEDDAAPAAAPNAEYRIHVGNETSQVMMFSATYAAWPGDSQTVQVRRTDADEASSVVASGTTDTLIAGENGLQVWTGIRAETFGVDLQFLQTARSAIEAGRPVREWPDAAGRDSLANEDVFALVLEVPAEVVREAAGPDIRFCTTVVAHDRQVGYCSHPMVGANVIPEGQRREFNETPPGGHWWRYGRGVRDRLTPLANGSVANPAQHAADLTRELLQPVRFNLDEEARFDLERRNGIPVAANHSDVFFSRVFGRPISTGLPVPPAVTEMPYLPAPR